MWVADVCGEAMSVNRWDKATQNVADSVAKCQERTVAVSDVRLQTVLNKPVTGERKLLIERIYLVISMVVFLKAMNEIKQSISKTLRIIIN